MKVSDLMDDLETGDRTNEHLTKPAVDDASLFQRMREEAERLMNIPQQIGGFLGGGLGGGLAQHLQGHQNMLNTQMNQQLANQQALGMQSIGAIGAVPAWGVSTWGQ